MNRPRLTPSVIPNLFTAMNMFCGFLSIINTNTGNYTYAAWLIFIAGSFDALDGLVARFTKSSSELGVELDSLSDIVSFGAAPAFLLYQTYLYQLEVIGIIICSLPLIVGGFRLARFNVQLVGYEKSFFIGLPIPVSALTISSFVLAFYSDGIAKPFSDLIIPMILVLSYLMVSNIRYETIPKFTIRGMKEKPFHFLFLAIGVLLIAVANKRGLFLTFVFMILIGIFRHIYTRFAARSDQ